MNLLSKLLPFGTGRGGYEPNFKVGFGSGQEGLDGIVALATSQQSGTFVLGESKLPEPAAKLQVYLKPGHYSTAGDAGYILEARIAPVARQKLGVEPSSFNTEFNVSKVIEDVYYLYVPLLPSYVHIDVKTSPPGNQGGIELSNFVAYGNKLTVPQVKDALTAFAKALEIAVNSVYNHAVKPSPKLTLSLTAGEEVKRIGQKPIEAPTLTTTKPPETRGSAGSAEDSASVSLEALASDVTFSDIGGYQNVKDELSMFLLGIRNPEAAKRHGYAPAKGILLYGPPGTGKTLFGKAIAGEIGANFFYVDPTELLDKYVGESPKMLRQLFENAAVAAKQSKKPAIVFIDEIDTILIKRSSEGGSDAVTSQLVNVFNQYMDGFKTGKIPNVYVVAATNRFDELDKAAVRPPRVVHVEVPLPDLEARAAIFKVRAQSMEREAGAALFSQAIDYAALANGTEGCSGAEIANVLTEARKKAFDEAAKKGQKEPTPTAQEELEAEIAVHKKKSGSGKGRIGFGRRAGG